MRITTKSTAIAVMAIHAPWVNLVINTTISTVPVTSVPKALMARLRCMASRLDRSVVVARSRVQCRTMPVWLSVKETNTPTM